MMSQRAEPRAPQLRPPAPGHRFGAGGAIVGCVLLFAVVYAAFLLAVLLGWVNVGA